MSTYKSSNMVSAPSSYDNCPGFLEQYLCYLENFRNKRPSTVIESCVTLREFCQYVHFKNRFHEAPSTKDAHKDLSISNMNLVELCNVRQDDIEEYLIFLDTVVRNKAQTLKKKLVLLREFYSYVDSNADELAVVLLDGNPTRYIQTPKSYASPVDLLTYQQLEQLMNGAFGDTALRDKTIILLIATTAITLSEVVAMNRSDLEDGKLIIRQSGKEPRTIQLTPTCIQYLQKYMAESAGYFEGDSAMFKSSDGRRRLTSRAIQFRIEKTAINAGLGHLHITAQTLRDTAASMIIASTPSRDRRWMLQYLGYSSPHAVQRFSALLPNRADEHKHSLNYLQENSALSKLGSSTTSRTSEGL